MSSLKKSLQVLASVAAIGGLVAATAAPVAAQTNPCAPAASRNPCAAKKGNPCAAKAAVNPCAVKKTKKMQKK